MELLNLLIILALVATVVSFGWGIGSMAHGGSFDDKHSVELMSARVGFQGLAVVLLLLALALAAY